MNKSKIIRLSLSVFFAATFLLSAFQLGFYKVSESNANNLYNNAVAEVVTPITNAENESNSKVPIDVDFNLLALQSDDVVGWLYSPNTGINYPVVKGKDNSEYLKKMFNGEKNRAGSLFVDYRLGELENSLNYVIYGHNMKNDSMFGTLTEYKKQAYYDAHPTFYYLTPHKSYLIELYAGYTTPADSNAYELNHSQQSLADYMTSIKKKSSFKSDVQYNEGDQIITLSTCAYSYDDARYVVIGIVKEL